MYVPAHFALSDVAALHAFMRSNVFAVFAGNVAGRIQFAYAPLVLDPEPAPLGGVRFHLARANPLADIEEGAELKLSIMGPHAYVSPDWYATPGQVPTWNYIAVEGLGRVRRLSDDGLKQLLFDLAAQEESALAPKPAWTTARVPPERLNVLLNAIVGFRLPFEMLEGKMKLSQNRNPEDRKAAIEGLTMRGDSASVAVAEAMRNALDQEIR
ncbi:MAG TPA: FMN-binding negative transcriptional regulator [Micropepsaceae bacterium]|nr:FMN-binding negative transcriptional regulator [Micropepsaceae bacterium]